MQLHQVQPTHKAKQPKRIGRGGKKGTYSGKGVKGQSARAGANFQPYIRELMKRYPKLRGYTFKARQYNLTILSLAALGKAFQAGEVVSPASLKAKRLLQNARTGARAHVKILSKGEIAIPLTIEKCEVSKSAKEKIEKAGGTIR